jgi:hypothetical protein
MFALLHHVNYAAGQRARVCVRSSGVNFSFRPLYGLGAYLDGYPPSLIWHYPWFFVLPAFSQTLSLSAIIVDVFGFGAEMFTDAGRLRESHWTTLRFP